MNTQSRIGRFMRNSGPARFFVPFGIIAIIIGVVMMVTKTDNYVQTVGKVSSVVEGDFNNEENRQEYNVTVSYTVDGKQYESEFINFATSADEYKVGQDFKLFYDPANPENTTNLRMPAFIPPIIIAAGAALIIYGIMATVKSFKKSKALDETAPGRGVPEIDFNSFKDAPDVTEIYCRFDGVSLRPGYIIEDADRNLLFEGKMLKNNPVGPRTFQFVNHVTGETSEHAVGHVGTTQVNNSFFSVSSTFKVDGKDIWDLLHERGLRMSTDMLSKFPRLMYNVARDGRPFARIETTSKYVHEDEEAQHKIAVPVNKYFYRIWTNSEDIETVFLMVFGISESEQTMVE